MRSDKIVIVPSGVVDATQGAPTNNSFVDRSGMGTKFSDMPKDERYVTIIQGDPDEPPAPVEAPSKVVHITYTTDADSEAFISSAKDKRFNIAIPEGITPLKAWCHVRHTLSNVEGTLTSNLTKNDLHSFFWLDNHNSGLYKVTADNSVSIKLIKDSRFTTPGGDTIPGDGLAPIYWDSTNHCFVVQPNDTSTWIRAGAVYDIYIATKIEELDTTTE